MSDASQFMLIDLQPLTEGELAAFQTRKRPEDWLDIRSEIHEVVRWRQLNDLADKKPSKMEYDRFHSATDSLMDFGEIIRFARNREWPTALQEGYLWLVGTLQSLTVIRDATIQFSKCLGVENITVADELFSGSNELRIAAIGHPAAHRRGGVAGATFLIRSMKKQGQFEIGTYPENGEFLIRTIDMPSLIDATERAAAIYMRHCYNAVVRSNDFETPDWYCFSGTELLS